MVRTVLTSVLKRLMIIAIVLNVAVVLVSWLLPDRVGLFSRTPELASDSASVAAAASFAANRSPLIDKLLPAGAGGTYIVPELADDNGGVAYLQSSIIAISSRVAADQSSHAGASIGEVVEVHERAHLIDAAHPGLVRDLIQRLPSPDTGEYAATDSREHFAEMLANAWEIVRMQDATGFCPAFDQAVIGAEQRIPGTAGMVMWFLPAWTAERGSAPDSLLLAAASTLSAGYESEWRRVAAAVEQQRDTTGQLAAWPVPDAAQSIRMANSSMIDDDHWWPRIVAWTIAPGVSVARLLGRRR